MNKENIIGIDVSKKKLDLALRSNSGEYFLFECLNNVESIALCIKEMMVHHGLSKDQLLLCCEYTGHYINPLRDFCEQKKCQLWIESGAQIKNSQGIQRGKNDKLDARRIAEYAWRFQDKAQLYEGKNKSVEALSYLSSERELLTKQIALFKGQLSDQQKFIDKSLYASRKKRIQAILLNLNKQLKEIDDQLLKVMKKDPELDQQFKLLNSVDGVGPRTAIGTIIATRGFKKISQARQFACYAGVAPFRYQSGTSQHSANRVSHRANKTIKTLLHMAALSAIQMKGELRDYFERKVKEGKNKMKVINAVRAKIIARMFSVIQRGQKYEKIYTPTLV